jgi:hypothetical protein
MPKIRYHRLDLASRQLQTAVALFLRGGDLFSVITLAGAASGLLTQLVINAGKQPFVDYGRLVQSQVFGSATPSREKYNRQVNDQFGVNALRHHAPTDAPTMDLDERVAAERALIRALVDYIELQGQRDPFVAAFLHWLWVTHDGKKIMSEYESLPKNLKRLRK